MRMSAMLTAMIVWRVMCVVVTIVVIVVVRMIAVGRGGLRVHVRVRVVRCCARTCVMRVMTLHDAMLAMPVRRTLKIATVATRWRTRLGCS